MRWVEFASGFKRIGVIREVIVGLRNVGQENLEAFGERDAVVFVLFDSRTQNRENFGGTFLIGGVCRTQVGHKHVRAHVHIVIGHGVVGGFGGVWVLLRAMLHAAHVHAGHAVVILISRRRLLRILRLLRKRGQREQAYCGRYDDHRDFR